MSRRIDPPARPLRTMRTHGRASEARSTPSRGRMTFIDSSGTYPDGRQNGYAPSAIPVPIWSAPQGGAIPHHVGADARGTRRYERIRRAWTILVVWFQPGAETTPTRSGCIQPRARPIETAPARLAVPSFVRIAATWRLAPLGEIPSRRAICLLLNPSARRAKTCRSRGVRLLVRRLPVADSFVARACNKR